MTPAQRCCFTSVDTTWCDGPQGIIHSSNMEIAHTVARDNSYAIGGVSGFQALYASTAQSLMAGSNIQITGYSQHSAFMSSAATPEDLFLTDSSFDPSLPSHARLRAMGADGLPQ